MASKILFDHTSISTISPYFYIDEQVTIIGIGMPEGDYLTFEVAEINPAARARNCGCDLIPPGDISLARVQELTCPSCVGSPVPVTLTSANPVVILDYPQGVFLRAIYHGDGLETGNVVVRAVDSSTGDVTPEMRGCPPVCCEDTEERTWEPTGVFRCNLADETYQERWRSNCNEFEWRDAGPLVWEQTADTRCVGEDVETRFRNQCNDSEWRVTGEVVWNETSEFRCVGENVETRFVNQCGVSEWRVTGEVEWSETADIRCVGTNVETRFTNQCGASEWMITGPQTWNDTGVTRCTGGGDVEAQQANDCGQVRWQNRGPAQWHDTATTRCANDVVEVFQQSDCGQTRWFATEMPCNTYIPTLDLFCGARAFRPTDPRDPAATVEVLDCCNNDTVVGYIYPTPRVGATIAVTRDECNECGIDSVLGYAVDWDNSTTCQPCALPPSECVPAWVNEGAPICQDETLQQPQVDGCGNTRFVDLGVACGGCTPDYQATENFRCYGGYYQQRYDDANNCGGPSTWQNVEPIEWTPTGAPDSCRFGTWHEQVENQCGIREWHTTGEPCADPCTPDWEPTGNTRCQNPPGTDLPWVQQEEDDGCGNIQWVNTATPNAWVRNDPLVWQCIGQILQVQETNACGTTRWVNVTDDNDPANDWQVTSEYRCTGNIEVVERASINRCGRKRWIAEPAVWVPTGNLRCNGALDLIEQELESQCNATKWVLVEPNAPCELLWPDAAAALYEVYSINDIPVNLMRSRFILEIKPNGSWQVSNTTRPNGSSSGTPASGNWHPVPTPTVGTGYEVKFEVAGACAGAPCVIESHYDAGYPGVTPYSWSASTGWLSLSSARQVTVDTGMFSASGADLPAFIKVAGYYTVSIRAVGSSGAGTPMVFDFYCTAEGDSLSPGVPEPPPSP